MSYTEITASASALLTAKGTAVTFSYESTPAYDPDTGAVSSTTSTATGNGVLTNYRNFEIDGSNIRRNDRKLVYSGAEPTVGATWDGYKVVSVNPINPDNTTAIIYIVQLRK